MRVFGGLEQLERAPERKVQEQTLVWIAELKAENEHRQREQEEIERASRR
jgi:hypothetical protein